MESPGPGRPLGWLAVVGGWQQTESYVTPRRAAPAPLPPPQLSGYPGERARLPTHKALGRKLHFLFLFSTMAVSS